MPRNARTVEPGILYHVTQRGTNRDRVFFSIADRHLYLRLISENLAEAGARILAYCLMSNHVHFVVMPERDDSLAMLFARANGRYAQAVNIRRGRSCGHLWQARFHSCAMSDSHFWVALRYVEENPCRAGLVQAPEAYRWSSAAAHLGIEPDRSRVLDMEFWRQAGGVETWRELQGCGSLDESLSALRKCTYSGKPFGDESFLSSMEERFHRRWRRTKADSPAQIAISA
jgi:putative transposase